MPARRSLPTIRRADARDAGLLAELGARTFSETFAADNTPVDLATYLAASFSPEKQAAELADPHTTFLVAEIDEAVTGYAQIHAGDVPACVTGPKPVELVRLYASRESLGRGVGHELMRACVNEARRARHQTIWLGVWERNERAQTFYRKWGFRVVGEHTFRLGSDPQNDLIMERQIS